MTEVKLYFGDVQINQTLGIEIDKNNNDFSNVITFKASRTGAREAAIGITPSDTATNFVDALELDYNFYTNGDIAVSSDGRVVTFSYDETVLTIKYFYGSAITSGTISEFSNGFFLKYWFEFKDIKSIVHRVEISKNNFAGSSTQIYGSCSLEYSETKDTLEPVRGSGLQIDLDASSDLNFYDLYSEEERTFSVVYKRGGQVLFNGWLSPEGIYESLVSDKWVISLDCTDGLGFLKNLSYVEDATGLNFVGKQSLLEIVSNCLKRTKTPQNILTSVKIYYDGLNQALNTFDNVYFNADRFIKEDDNETIMNCDEVLKSVLEPFGAVITSFKGEWLIYKPNSLVGSSLQIFFTYDSLGVVLNPTTKTIDFALSLGSQIDNYYPHHANGNQQKTIKSSIGAFRINYKYGLVKSFIDNKYLLSNSDTDIPGYNILDGNYLSFFSDREGVIISQFSTITAVLETSDIITLPVSSVFDFFIEYSIFSAFVFGRFEVILTGTSNTYYLKKLGIINEETNSRTYETEWTTSQTYITAENLTPGIRIEKMTLKSQSLPEAGNIKVVIYTADQSFGSSNFNFNINELNIIPSVTDNNLQGENHTFQRTLKPSSKIKDVKKVFNGDDETDIYVGTIYKADKTTPTDFWTRQGASETKPILRIMGEERMKMYSKPLQVYKGDVYGYFNYLSLVTINGLTGKFMPTTYSYDALNNITALELTEVLNTDILSDVNYEVTFDYGNVVEPTIKG